MGAALAAAVSCVLVGVGVGVGTAEESPAAVSRSVEAPPVPAAAPTTEPVAPRAAPTTTAPAPTAEPSEDPEPDTGSTTAGSTTAGSTNAAPDAAEPEPESPPARASVPARSAAAPELVPGTPCTVTAKACADLGARTAWLIEDGAVRRGPVPIMIGDEIDPTPVGTFTVEWKAEAWTSREYLTQMPYSVFFAEGGIAFHEGNQETPSAGCIKLGNADAMAWFEYLQVGDEVQVR